ncbi:MAG: DUF6176 family protein, partial [Lacticaseibacillus paracasei]
MSVELKVFTVYPDKIARVKAWMAVLKKHQKEIDVTLSVKYIL